MIFIIIDISAKKKIYIWSAKKKDLNFLGICKSFGQTSTIAVPPFLSASIP